jgi:phosphopantothenoylcysteine decarboxylase/phosphopantothenate--cysteine ligase
MHHSLTMNGKILIGIGGGIAAYKVCEVISQLFQVGVQVRVILTEAAQEFITPLTVATLSRHRAYTDKDFWQPIHQRPLHIELGEWADILAIAPLTANTLGKLAHGSGDNLLTSTVLASRCPILLAPATNTEMWEQMAVQRNWRLLLEDSRYHSVGPDVGLLACDRVGSGRMAEPEVIKTALQSLLHTFGKRDLVGKKILISTGSTREYLDSVRFIGNPATGKMGVAIALAAAHRGASVTLVCGAIDRQLIPNNPQICSISAPNAASMQQAIEEHYNDADWTIMAAAVADVKPAHYTTGKLAKQDLPSSLELAPVNDILAELGKRKQKDRLLVGFAAQTGDIITPAIEKLKRKNLDAIVANPVDVVGAGFASDTNQAIIIDRRGRQQEISSRTKLELGHILLDFLTDFWRDDLDLALRAGQ